MSEDTYEAYATYILKNYDYMLADAMIQAKWQMLAQIQQEG